MPVVFVDLNDKDEKALNVALNSPAISGEFTGALDGVLEELAASDLEMFESLRLGELFQER